MPPPKAQLREPLSDDESTSQSSSASEEWDDVEADEESEVFVCFFKDLTANSLAEFLLHLKTSHKIDLKDIIRRKGVHTISSSKQT
jgi:hypothetical protein